MNMLSGAMFTGFILLLASVSATAETADGQISRVETNIRNIARALSRVDTDKDMRGVSAIIRDAKKAARSVEELAKVAGDDQRAIDLVNSYNTHIRDFISALGAISQIKQWQFNADGLGELCDEIYESFESEVEEIVKSGDSNGVEKIENLANTYKLDAENWLEESVKTKKHIKERVRMAKRFNVSRNPWKQVSGTLHAVAESMRRYYENEQGNADRMCDQLLDGERTTFVRHAIEELEDIDLALKKYSDDVEEWFEGTRDVFRNNCTALNNLREAYCINDYEGSSDTVAAGRELADQIANARAKEMVRQLRPIVIQHAELKKRGSGLFSRTGDAHTKKLLTSMGKRVYKLSEVQDTGAIKGSRHPMIQTWIKYGVDQHKKMESSHSCDIADKAIPGSRKRPDCIDVAECEILEFKPNNRAAIEKGKTQLNEYRILLETHLEKLISKQKISDEYDQSIDTGNPSSFGGEAMVQKAWDSGCIDDSGRVFFETTNPRTYKTCEAIALNCTK